MIVQPVSIRDPEIHALVAGTMSVLIRPIGRLAVLKARDLLWVREPFHLDKFVDNLAPTAAAARGETPIYVADEQVGIGKVRALGRRRNAREMPKVWHRQHLRVTSIEQLQLHDVAAADLQGAGWNSLESYQRRWDEDARFFGARVNKSNFYAKNPPVLRIAFDRIAAPLPEKD